MSLAAALALSSVQVNFPEHRYGTRSSTLLMTTARANGGWQMTMQERLRPSGDELGDVQTAVAVELPNGAVVALGRVR